MHLNKIASHPAPQSFNEYPAGAQVAYSRNVPKTPALPVNPHIPRSRHSHHPSPRGNKTRESIRHLQSSLSSWAVPFGPSLRPSRRIKNKESLPPHTPPTNPIIAVFCLL